MTDVWEERGKGDVDPETSAEIRKYLNREKQPSLSNLEEIARIALNRFPELLPGEKISIKEIKTRLRDIREAGYDVKPYSKMNTKEAWNYLQRIRKYVCSIAKTHCPKLLMEINRANKQSIEDAVNIR